MINAASVLSAIAPDVTAFETMATNFAKSRFLVLSTEFNDNEKEAAEIEKIADRVRCTIELDGSAFLLHINFEERSGNYFEIMTEGMPAPLTGGEGGIAHNPDGTAYHSAVPPQFWGQPLEGFAETGVDIVGEIKMMLTDLFKNHIQEAVRNNKQEIAEIAKASILQDLQFNQG